MNQALNVLPSASSRIKELLEKRGKPSIGIRLGIRTKGCSGLSYTIEYADVIEEGDEIIETDGVKILIDPKSFIFLIGTKMEYVEEKMKSGFKFNNPQVKGSCGCGESFHV